MGEKKRDLFYSKLSFWKFRYFSCYSFYIYSIYLCRKKIMP